MKPSDFPVVTKPTPGDKSLEELLAEVQAELKSVKRVLAEQRRDHINAANRIGDFLGLRRVKGEKE